jgi:hypothetical protein
MSFSVTFENIRPRFGKMDNRILVLPVAMVVCAIVAAALKRSRKTRLFMLCVHFERKIHRDGVFCPNVGSISKSWPTILG